MVGGILIIMMVSDCYKRSVSPVLMLMYCVSVFALTSQSFDLIQGFVSICLAAVGLILWRFPRYETCVGSADLLILSGFSLLLPVRVWFYFIHVLAWFSLLFAVALICHKWPGKEPVPFLPILVLSYAII